MTDPTPTAALVSALEAMLDMDERCNDTGVPADECDRIRAQARAALAARPSPSAGSLVEARDPNGCTIHDYLRVLVQAWGRYIASGCTNTSVHEYAVIALNDVCRLYPQSALAAVPPVVEPVALPCREKGQHLYACVWCNVASVTAPPTTEPPAPTPPTTEPVVRCVTCGMTSLGWLHARENWGTTWDMQDGREQTGLGSR